MIYQQRTLGINIRLQEKVEIIPKNGGRYGAWAVLSSGYNK